MDVRYPAYCIADKRYYESPAQMYQGDGWFNFVDEIATPDGWSKIGNNNWTQLNPPEEDAGIPAQGWKIHVSATPDNAVPILKQVSEYCFVNLITFKFVPNSLSFASRNSKYAPRESSGKFITIYPADVVSLRRTLHELNQKIGGEPGPYILSDLRWDDGPMYVRYGGFAPRYVYGDDGSRVPAIEAPDGSLEPDRREPKFVIPDWLEIPDFLTERATPRISSEQPEEFPYRVTGVLHFSNGGGVYQANRLKDNMPVVLKEGRPHAGLDNGGRDAPSRLRVEHAAMSKLANVSGIPEVYEYHTFGGHGFLAMEQVSGISLQQWIVLNYPNFRGSTPEENSKYRDSAQKILTRLEEILAEIHSHGYVLNDLHPSNVMVDDDLDVMLVDFETVTSISEAGPRLMNAPGFGAPEELIGVEADMHSFRVTQLHVYIPLTSLLELCPEQARPLLNFVRPRFALTDDDIAPLTTTILAPWTSRAGLRPLGPEVTFGSAIGPWDSIVSELRASIRASATPERLDRLFPGDIDQFTYGGGGVAFGAAGVLDALRAAGETDLEPFVDWLCNDVKSGTQPRFGFYDGMAGISHTLYSLGQQELAMRILDQIVEEDAVQGTKLFDGLSGTGLAALDLYRRTGKVDYLTYARAAAETVKHSVESGNFTQILSTDGTRHTRERRGNAAENFWGGLLYGWSGLALFLTRMYEVTGEDRWLHAALAAMHRDLDGCQTQPDGSLQVKNGRRVLPYVATGSAGVALVGDLILRHLADERLEEAIPDLARACIPEFCSGGGLFNGMAGLVGTLHQVGHRLGWADLEKHIDSGVAALSLYAFADEHGMIFAGEQNLRVSTDLATGSAGVLRLINVLSGETAELMPFLGADSWNLSHPELPAPSGLV